MQKYVKQFNISLYMEGPILLVAGARPNFMKLAPVHRSLLNHTDQAIVIHTGQHYDYNMSEIFFEELGIVTPDYHLEVGSGSHAIQTAKIMIEFEKLCHLLKPCLTVVFGDVNSTVACSLVSAKMGVPVAHVESGLRSFDRKMPEEINRIITDHLSSILFTTTEFANLNLRNEGIEIGKISFVGNVMIDTIIHQSDKIDKSKVLQRYNLDMGDYDVITLHRPSNVDRPERLSALLSKLSSIENTKGFIFPIHPRTLSNIRKFKLEPIIKNITLIDPLGYHDFSNLIKNANSVWTDSGGIQEECTHYSVPCFTLRENTERPETISLGSNRLVNIQDNFSQLYNEINQIEVQEIPLWDGESSSRISEEIMRFLTVRNST
jgi:UDP-N-acetylglucosamine 2-epimerase (non-hydrolysing)